MINSITLENFKSYRKATLHFSPLTLFIGANASGKSNSLEAIRLLQWLAKGSRIDDIERNIQGTETLVRGKSSDLFNFEAYKIIKPKNSRIGKKIRESFSIACNVSSNGSKEWNDLSLSIGYIGKHISIKHEVIKNHKENILYEIIKKTDSNTDAIKVAYNNFKKGGKKPQIPCSNKQAIFYQLQSPARFHADHVKSQQEIPSTAKKFRTALESIVFLDPQPALMRGYVPAGDQRIKEDGSNVSSVLYTLLHDKNGISEILLQFIQSLPEQEIQAIDFIKTERNDVMLQLSETFGNKKRKVDAPLLSDGTMRVLAVAAALLSAPQGSLVIIEEIDNGIHPSRADHLLQSIRNLAEKRYLHVLITSHNPALLDAVPNDCLGDVLCCYRDPDKGDSKIVRLKDLYRYPELVIRGTLGHLATKGILDQFLKDKRKPVERIKESLGWLKELKAECAQ